MEKNISATVQCFVKNNDKYLMLLRSNNKKLLPGILVAPGGHKHFKEGIFECAKREIFEETGVEIDNISVKAIGIGHSLSFDENREYCNYILMAKYISGDLKQNDDDGTLKWLTYEEIKNHENLFVEVKELLPYIFNNESNIVSYIVEYDNINSNKSNKFSIEN